MVNNLKINNSLVQRITAGIGTIVLVGSMGFVSLSNIDFKPKDKLKGTMLEGAAVITLSDGSKMLAKAVEDCESSKYGHHYIDMQTGQLWAASDCMHPQKHNPQGLTILHTTFTPLNKDDFEVSDVSRYLTEEEINALKSGNMSDEMLTELFMRIARASESLNEEQESSKKNIIN